MKVIVTGASGFIGTHLLRALAVEGVEVVALGRRQPAVAVAEWHAVDVADPVVRLHAAHADAIVHLAALSDASLSLREPLTYSLVNALGTAHLLEAARESGAFFVLASSQRVYQPSANPLAEDAPLRPTEPYGYSKLVAELWVKMYREVYGLPTTALRFFSVYGPGQGRPGAASASGVVSILLHRATAGEEVWVDGAKRRDLTYVGDVVAGILAALGARARCRPVYNIASGEGTALADLARLVLDVTGSRSRLALRGGDGGEDDLVADIALARADLDYAPHTGLREGLIRTYEWLLDERAHTT
ncbi:MAG: NAD-dependent epimerase/dehydratase family protein [Chloroflexota bacterium]